MKKLKTLILATVSVMAIGLLAGCSEKDSVKTDENEKRVVTSLKGEVEIPANPERIVDVSGSSEELSIIGYSVVGTANVDSYQTDKVASYVEDKFGDAKVVGHSMMDTMDIEAILACEPDLIIMSDRQEKIYDQLKEIAPVVMIKDYGNDWRTKLQDVSKLFDKEDVANEWLSDYDAEAKKLGEEIIAKNGDKTYLSVLAFSQQFMIFSNAGIGTIVNDDMGLARPDNLPAQDDIQLPIVTMEGLTEINTDHIILIAAEADIAELEASAVWAEIRAVKEGNVTTLSASPFFSQSYNPIGRQLLLEQIKEELIK